MTNAINATEARQVAGILDVVTNATGIPVKGEVVTRLDAETQEEIRSLQIPFLGRKIWANMETDQGVIDTQATGENIVNLMIDFVLMHVDAPTRDFILDVTTPVTQEGGDAGAGAEAAEETPEETPEAAA